MTPQLGWTGVTNEAAAIPGSVVETDAQLRLRQTISTAQPSASMYEGLLGALRAVEEVTRVKVYENDTHDTDANGIPGHSICCVVENGESASIAETIFNRKPIGCGTYGEETETVTDSYGNKNSISFQRPAYVDFDVTVTVKPLTGYSEADTPAAIAAGIASYLNSLTSGDGLTVSLLWWAAMNTMAAQSAPTFSITSVTVGRHGEAQGTEDIALTFDEVARGNVNYIEAVSYKHLGVATAGRSVSAYELFLEIMEAREPVTLVTRLKTYDNMMITAISASDSAQTMFGLRASVSLQQIRRVSVATMSIQQTCSSSKITYEQADTSNAWNGFVSPEVVLGSLYGDSDYSGTTSTTPIYPSGSGSSGGSNSSILNDIWDWASGIWRS